MIANRDATRVTAVIPNWNGRGWLPRCLEAISAQQVPFSEVLIVDNGSSDDSVAYLRTRHPDVKLIELHENTGFAHAANVGIGATRASFVALVNTDVVLSDDWLERMLSAIDSAPENASVACKMLALEDPTRIYDAGDVLRRDGACEQRGRFARDDGRWDRPEEVFGACAGAALYRRDALLEVGGFDERYFAYLEDVDLALRLRLAGWSCRYEPVVALHAAQGSSHALPGGHEALVARNTLILVAKAFPLRWLPYVGYRQLAWIWHAAQDARLGTHMRALAAAFSHLPGALRDRRAIRSRAVVSVEEVVPARPFRGRLAGGHPAQITSTEEPVQ
jgi:GT2 family glycosyltransferase